MTKPVVMTSNPEATLTRSSARADLTVAIPGGQDTMRQAMTGWPVLARGHHDTGRHDQGGD
jgi:hypothetical protein